jgi:hypothetical protein
MYPSEHVKTTLGRLQMRLEIGRSAQMIDFDSINVFIHNTSGQAITIMDDVVGSRAEKRRTRSGAA